MPEQVVYAGAAGSGKATQTVSYTYDALGRPLATTNASGTTTDHYDAQGNLTEADTPEVTIHYAFGPATGRHTETYTDDTDTAYDYDRQGRLWHVTVKKLNGQTLATPLVTTYAYDAAGNKQTETLPDGEVTTYSYDDLNRLTGVVEVQGATTLFSQNYVLNDDGTRKSVDETPAQPRSSSIVASHTDWTYDADGRLTRETVTSTAAGQSYADSYTFNLGGNRIGKVHTASGQTDTAHSFYNERDQLLRQEVDLHGDGTIDSTTLFSYDADGSTTEERTVDSQGATVSDKKYLWDVQNHLVGLDANGDGDTTDAGDATFTYDSKGVRVGSHVVGGDTTTDLLVPRG